MKAAHHLGLSLLLFIFQLASFASTPSSGTINTPADNSLGVKQTITYFGGPFAVSTGFSNLTLPACVQAVTPPGACDIFNLNVALPANYYDTHASRTTVTLTWAALAGDSSLDDLDVYIVDAAGNDLGHSADTNPAAAGGTGNAREFAFTGNLRAGGYRIVVMNSLSATPVTRYDVTVNFELVAPPVPAPATAQIFAHYQPPVPTNGTARLGTSSGEPSIGVNLKTGNVMYQASLQTLRVTFDDNFKPATATWANVGSTLTSRTSFDPILWTSPRTGRTFVSQLDLACSLMAFSDVDGATWFQNPLGCGIGTAFDHQTVGGGAFAPGLSANDPVFNYKDSVVYCAHDDVTGACATSTDGGITFGVANQMYNTTQCQTIHGHIRSGPDGYLYVPNKSCNSQQSLIVSGDNGKTWTIHPVPGSHSGNFDPWVDIGPQNTIYFGYTDGNGHPYIVTSRDHGTTFSAPFDAGASAGVQNSEFASVVVGDDNRAAFAFLGSTVGGNDQADSFDGAWALYVSFTYDGGSTWTTYNTTPNDPVQRGCIWAGGGETSICRNLLDFMGITVDKVGRVLVGYPDGCIDDPQAPANQCVSNASSSQAAATTRTHLASIARQIAGVGLFAKYDGVISTTPASPVLSGLAGNKVSHLNWTVPNDGGAPINGYKIYRGNAANGETLLTTVAASTTSYDDTAVTNGTTYYYRVSARNQIGDSATSNEVALTPMVTAAPSAPRKLKARGKGDGIALTWWAPASEGTAKITGYKIYRGLTPGGETLLTTVGNQLQYSDPTAAGITYYYVVTAVNSVGESAKSNEDSAQLKPGNIQQD